MQYEEWMEEGKRNVVKRALQVLAKDGSRSTQGYYLTFRTSFPGVQITHRLRELYPEEMTIVLSDAFWNLEVHDQYFSLELLFDQKKEFFHIPLKALVHFIDPALEFAIQLNWKVGLPNNSMENVIYLKDFRREVR